jgi:hypothetical protein
VGDDVDAFRANQPKLMEENMYVPCGRRHVITFRRDIAVAETAGIDGVNLASLLDQQRDDVSPGVPALRPAWDENYGLSFTRNYVVDAHAFVNGDQTVLQTLDLRTAAACGGR